MIRELIDLLFSCHFSASLGRVMVPDSQCFLWLCFAVCALGEAAASSWIYGGILPPAQLEILDLGDVLCGHEAPPHSRPGNDAVPPPRCAPALKEKSEDPVLL